MDFDDLVRAEKELEQQVYVADGHIVIDVEYEYNVPLSQCDSAEKLLGWTYHLTEKTWMKNDVMRRFIELACHENGMEIPHL